MAYRRYTVRRSASVVTTGWGKITRGDIKTFDDKSTDLILRAMNLEGVEGRLTTRSHCLLRSPNGETMSISRKMSVSNRSSQNVEASWNRIFGAMEQEAIAQAQTEPIQVPVFQTPQKRSVGISHCPVETCGREFPTMGGLYSHTRRDHAVCLECNPALVLDGERELRMHNQDKHTEPDPVPEEEGKPEVFECPECGKKYEKSRFMAAHRWKAHGVPGESTRSKERSKKRASVQHVTSDVQCTEPGCGTWHKNNRLLGLHKWTAHQIPGATKQTPAKMHTTPPSSTETMVQRAEEPVEEPVEEPKAEDEVQWDLPTLAPPDLYDSERVIKEIVSVIPMRYMTDSAEVERLRSVVEGLQSQLGAVTRDRDELKARLDLLREAMGA